MALNNKPGDPAAGGGGEPNPNPGTLDFKSVEALVNGLAEKFQKGLNALDMKFNGLKTQLETKPAGGDPAPNPNDTAGEPAPEPKESRTIAELNVRLANLEKQNKALADETKTEKEARAAAEAKALETDRMSKIDAYLSTLPFPPGKAKQQFRDAYQSKVKRDDSGELIVETDKGPLGFDVFLQSEFEASPHLQNQHGHSGAGASGGAKPSGTAKLLDVTHMTTEQILKADPAQLQATLQNAVSEWTGQ